VKSGLAVRRIIEKCVLGVMLVSAISCSSHKPQENHIYSTWDNLEVDKCASAWLIKRFIDREAVFRFYRVGKLIPAGIPFDTPEAELRRYHNMSTFESAMRKYGIKDVRLQKIGTIIHRLEVVSWEERMPEKDKLTMELEKSIRVIIESSKTPLECFEKSSPVFDELYASLRETNEDTAKAEASRDILGVR